MSRWAAQSVRLGFGDAYGDLEKPVVSPATIQVLILLVLIVGVVVWVW